MNEKPSQEAETQERNSLVESWKVVEKSRHPQRPYALDYIENVFENFEELKGDRAYKDDPAIVAGIAEFVHPKTNKREGVFIVANQKGRKTKEKVLRNFGMAKPEGYRKAIRVYELAERFKKPLITFIDTPGAFPGVGAEERGQSVAIAESIRKMFEIKTPSIGIVIGEGGSGGALALGVTDHLYMLQNSIYSVISPESCAAILWGNSAEMRKAAHSLKLSAPETLELGLCDELIKEKGDGAHAEPEAIYDEIKTTLSKSLNEFREKDLSDIQRSRLKKFRNIDAQNINIPSE